MNKEEIIKVLQDNNFAPQKSKGQNFLIDDDISRKIVSLIAKHNKNVVEIGPGLGALTHHLVARNLNVIAIEIDKGFARYLKEKYQTINVITSDFLKEKVSRETQVIISNVPYYITTKVIEKVISEESQINQFIFMIQKDVEVRLFAKPMSKEYGPLAVFLALFGNLKREIIVTRDKFYPAPHVDSAVYTFAFNEQIKVNRKEFYKFLKQIFLKRRKYLISNLSSLYDKDKLKDIFHQLAISEQARVEELTPQIISALFVSLY